MLYPYTYENPDGWTAVLEDPAFGPQSETAFGYSEVEALKVLILENPECFPWQITESYDHPGHFEVRRDCFTAAEGEALKQILGTVCGQQIRGSTKLVVVVDDDDEAAMELEEHNLELEAS